MEIVIKEEFTAVGFIVQQDWEGLIREMPVKWDLYKNSVTEIDKRKTDVMMDISLEQHQGIYTQFICAETDDDASVPKGMELRKIPTHRYLHHQHHGSLVGIAETFGEMYQFGKENRIELETMKIDIGYTIAGNETSHDLYIKVID
ncbi:GyrI-like domain-containing protein [Gracilibacillus massiliensis]|uniref:GyrI-like domain-containing protein n=1 Tax=Gracilibacillus massiliensis TaxID=1564956 RepID=UPI00071CD54E|nr:effector binding domain-containing protein [Gracilibacillus massiliensis]